MKDKEDYDINLGRFKTHQRKFPWSLIKKVIIAVVLIGLLVYLNRVLSNKEHKEEGIEVDVEMPSNAPEASPGQ
jgi:hypothetical protein